MAKRKKTRHSSDYIRKQEELASTVRSLAEAGKAISQIARAMKKSEPTVRSICQKHRIKINPSVFRQKKEKLHIRVRKLAEAGKAISQIMRAIKKSDPAVRSICRKHRITINPSVPRQKIEKLLIRMRKLANSGKSLSEIAMRVGKTNVSIYQLCRKNKIPLPRKRRGMSDDVRKRLDAAMQLYSTGTTTIGLLHGEFRLSRAYLIKAIREAGLSRSLSWKKKPK